MRCVVQISVAGVAALTGCNEHGQSPPDAWEECREGSIADRGQLFDGSTRTRKIIGATLVVRGDPTRSAVTDGEGKFTLCFVQSAGYSADVDPPGDLMGGVLVQASQPDTGKLMTFTVAELTAELAAAGQVYDPSTGIVITLIGDSPTLTGPHGPRLRMSATGWEQNGDGTGVFMFPNVPPGVQLVSQGIRVQVTAGAIVWVTIPPIPI